jgi:hypothetical protein
MTPAHIGGLPVEESVRALVPAAATTILYFATWLRRR